MPYINVLCWNIEKLFTTGKSPYPIERTLLTTTVLEFAMRSLTENGLAVPRAGRRAESPGRGSSKAVSGSRSGANWRGAARISRAEG